MDEMQLVIEDISVGGEGGGLGRKRIGKGHTHNIKTDIAGLTDFDMNGTIFNTLPYTFPCCRSYPLPEGREQAALCKKTFY